MYILTILLFYYYTVDPRFNEHGFLRIPRYIEQKYWFPPQILSWI